MEQNHNRVVAAAAADDGDHVHAGDGVAVPDVAARRRAGRGRRALAVAEGVGARRDARAAGAALEAVVVRVGAAEQARVAVVDAAVLLGHGRARLVVAEADAQRRRGREEEEEELHVCLGSCHPGISRASKWASRASAKTIRSLSVQVEVARSRFAPSDSAVRARTSGSRRLCLRGSLPLESRTRKDT
jgi:hypothetical protein